MEALCHDESCFVTLTYANEFEPAGRNLRPADLSLWLKRIRKEIEPRRIRYFAVGEYGEENLRPHYHLSLFGVSGFTPHMRVDGPTTFAECVDRQWARGFVQVAEFSEKTAQYVSGYVVKKLADRNDPRMEGLVPEFARMSRNPGLGTAAMMTIAKTLCESGHGMALIEDTGDVPRQLQIGKKKIPLGRFLLQKLREAIGFTPEYIAQIKASGTFEKSVEMLALLQNALDVEALATPRSAYLMENAQRINNAEARAKIWKKRGTL